MGDQFIECRCETCQRNVTLEEVAADFHKGHQFTPLERAAFQAVEEYVKSGHEGA